MNPIPSLDLEKTCSNPISEQLLQETITPYLPHCRYLKNATIEHPGTGTIAAFDSIPKEMIIAHGDFGISESCYIQDTGHFNSVEFNICLNQLSYVLVAYCIQHRLLKELEHLNLSDFKVRQLPDMVIVHFESSFKKPMRADRFTGRTTINRMSKRGNLVFMKTDISFQDNQGGFSEGNVMFALVNNSGRG